MDTTQTEQLSPQETLSLTHQRIEITDVSREDEDYEDDEDRRGSSNRRNSSKTNRRSKSGRNKSDSQSAGRKIAAREFPLDRQAPCEWRNQANCGGGDFPVLGCLEGLQEARHHGPDKVVQNNEPGNVHRICHYCLGKNMRILTSSMQWIKAEDVTVGLELIGFDEDIKRKGRPRLRRSIVESVQTVLEPSYKFYMEDGTELISSHKHQWVASPAGRTHPEWRTTESLLNNPTHPKSRYTLRKLFDTWQFNPTYESGYVSGFLDGEGSVSNGQFSFAQKNGNVYDNVSLNIIDLIGSSKVEETYYSGTNYEMSKLRVTNRKDIATILGTYRPTRLLENWSNWLDTSAPQAKGSIEKILQWEDLGVQEVVSIQTSTRTLIVNGYASHNCHYRWHARNDKTYDWNAGVYPPHNPRPFTDQEQKAQALDYMRYLTTGRRGQKLKELD